MNKPHTNQKAAPPSPTRDEAKPHRAELSCAIIPLSESALLINVAPDDIVTPRSVEYIAAFAKAIETVQLIGIIDIVPAYSTILVNYDPRLTDVDTIKQHIELLHKTVVATPLQPREIHIPVVYGGKFGPDLENAAHVIGLSPDEIILRHTAADYLVVCIGFSPGFPYLLGLPKELALPRLSKPRTHVPVGSVGIGGEQTGIYPQATPGGWQLIGRTPLTLFNPHAEQPCLLRVGDHIRFTAISADQYINFANTQGKG